MRDLVSSLGVSVSNSLRLPVAFYEVLSLTFAQLRVSDSLTVNINAPDGLKRSLDEKRFYGQQFLREALSRTWRFSKMPKSA